MRHGSPRCRTLDEPALFTVTPRPEARFRPGDGLNGRAPLESAPMSDIQETVTEAVERSSDSRLNAVIALLVAVTATFMAVMNVKSGNLSQAMQEAQAKTNDTWAYYQAKSTKQALAEATVDELVAVRDATPNITPEARAQLDRRIAGYQANVARYDKEKKVLQVEAQGYQKTYNDLNQHDDQFDLSDAALSVAIALFGITALTQKRWLCGFAILFMLFGIFFGLAGFCRWSVHPDAVMKWLSY